LWKLKLVTKVGKQHLGQGESSINTDYLIKLCRSVTGQSWGPPAPFRLAEVLELPDWTQAEMRLGARETSVQALPQSIRVRLQAPQRQKRESRKLHVATIVSTRA
jgi:hypothetical protein